MIINRPRWPEMVQNGKTTKKTALKVGLEEEHIFSFKGVLIDFA